MNKFLKWSLIASGTIAVLIVMAVLLIPKLVDINQYRPEIEKQITRATGRPFLLGGELDLSIFPWVGVSLSDIALGNPEEFNEKQFITVKRFEVRVKLLPLLSKTIQIKKFVLESPHIFLVKKKNGKTNWTMAPKGPSTEIDSNKIDPGKKAQGTKKSSPAGKESRKLPFKTISVDEFAVTNGVVQYNDQKENIKKEISDITLTLEDLSLENPIKLNFSAEADGHQVSLNGLIGPLGKDPGRGTIPLDITLETLEEITMTIKGDLLDPVETQGFDLKLSLSEFSPKKLMASLGKPLPATADPKVLERLFLNLNLKGDPKSISVSDALLGLDDSTLKFTAKAGDFSKPDIAFTMEIDRLNLDRYLPPPLTKEKAKKTDKTLAAPHQTAETSAASPQTGALPQPAARNKIDYTPFRNLVLEGNIKIGEFIANRARMENVQMKIKGKNGVFNLDPLDLRLYQGTISSRSVFDVRDKTPKITLNLEAKGIESGPMLIDVLQKEIIQGKLQSSLKLSMKGDTPDTLKKSLNGNGYLKFLDGAIVGIDIPGMVRNVTASFKTGERSAEKPTTDFAELNIPFTITNGLVETTGTTLASPLLRVAARGKADLVGETLDIRVEPMFVSTLKGQGDTEERSGIMVPVLVTGTFDKPKFTPDLKSMVKSVLPNEEEFKEIIKDGRIDREELKKTEEKVKQLFKGFSLD